MVTSVALFNCAELVIVTSAVLGDNYGVTVGYGVDVGLGVGSIRGVGVQVGGSDINVAVGDGMKMVGTVVGFGKGFSEESGFEKMERITITATTVATRVSIVSISQMESFLIIAGSLKSV